MIVVTIPAYNEESIIDKVIRGIKLAMSETKYKYQILVVNDGSKDRTKEVAEREGAIVVSHVRNRGLAETFKTEMRECLKLKADIIVHTDADGQYPSHYIPQLIQKIEEGNDLVLGSRFGSGNYSGSLMKSLGNKAFALVFSRLLKMKINDTTTGFRAFTKEIAQLSLINSFTYTQEQLIRVGKANMRISELPINTRKTRKSKLFKNPLDYALKAWINILRIYRDYDPLKFFGKIGFIFLFLGFLIGLRLIYFFITTGNVGHYPSITLTAVFLITGLQIILFGFFADMKKR